jgi:hypothetical protein
MASPNQNNDFIAGIMPSNLLDEAIGWIQSNLGPDDVFEDKDIREYVADNYAPADIFSKAELEDWAERNGYKKED